MSPVTDKAKKRDAKKPEVKTGVVDRIVVSTEQIKAILRDNPKNAAAHYFLGSIAFDEKRWDAAAESFAKAIEVNPAIEQAHYDLASAHIAAGRGELYRWDTM